MTTPLLDRIRAYTRNTGVAVTLAAGLIATGCDNRPDPRTLDTKTRSFTVGPFYGNDCMYNANVKLIDKAAKGSVSDMMFDVEVTLNDGNCTNKAPHRMSAQIPARSFNGSNTLDSFVQNGSAKFLRMEYDDSFGSSRGCYGDLADSSIFKESCDSNQRAMIQKVTGDAVLNIGYNGKVAQEAPTQPKTAKQ